VKARLTLLVALMAIPAIAIGCGGDSEAGGAEATASLSKPQFIKEATAACNQGREEIATFEISPEAERSETATAEAIATAVKTTFATILTNVVDEVEELGAPAGDEQQIPAYLDSMRKGIEEMEGRSAEPPTTVLEMEDVLRPAGDLARKYGMRFCGFG